MTVIQIGAHTGDDHVSEYLRKNQYNQAILIEANPYCIDQLTEYYKNFHDITIRNLAITIDGESSINLYIPSSDMISQHTSGQKNHLIRHDHQEICSVEVPATSINTIIEGHRDIRLYIDTEGLDIDIVNSTDFDDNDIKYLEFEYIHSDGPLSWGGPKLDCCLQRLEKYFTLSKNGYNICCERSKSQER